jgi:uncharacterized protein YodC (DUF2158 family)
MSQELRIGDTVRIKSGGPLMTVTNTGEIELGPEGIHVWCTWFNDKKQPENGVFHTATVSLIKPQ